MPSPNVRDVVSPAAFTAFQIFGLLVLAAAIAVALVALFDASLRLAREIDKFLEWRREQKFKFIPSTARVLAFPARKKTRNRLVIQ